MVVTCIDYISVDTIFFHKSPDSRQSVSNQVVIIYLRHKNPLLKHFEYSSTIVSIISQLECTLTIVSTLNQLECTLTIVSTISQLECGIHHRNCVKSRSVGPKNNHNKYSCIPESPSAQEWHGLDLAPNIGLFLLHDANCKHK